MSCKWTLRGNVSAEQFFPAFRVWRRPTELSQTCSWRGIQLVAFSVALKAYKMALSGANGQDRNTMSLIAGCWNIASDRKCTAGKRPCQQQCLAIDDKLISMRAAALGIEERVSGIDRHMGPCKRFEDVTLVACTLHHTAAWMIDSLERAQACSHTKL